MKVRGNGFVSVEGRLEAQRLWSKLQQPVELVERTINLCHRGLESQAMVGQATDVEKQKVIACVVLARMLEISESIIVLAKGGFSVDVTASLRNFLEAYFIFGNVCKDPAFVPHYFNTDLKTREKLLNVSDMHKATPFELIKKYATDDVRAEIKEQISSVDASEFNSYEYANNVGCAAIYDSIYRITSAATHSTPRSLAAYVVESSEGYVMELLRGPQLGDIPQRLHDLGSFLLTVRAAFDDLFGIDVSDEIKQLREAFETMTIAKLGSD
ncbi:MAG: DUF5677 domain-containing protein [Sulfurimicrobium sp.]|nr:DUF5677 domain-containing protein [Sulfurimicrobium sp.]